MREKYYQTEKKKIFNLDERNKPSFDFFCYTPNPKSKFKKKTKQ